MYLKAKAFVAACPDVHDCNCTLGVGLNSRIGALCALQVKQGRACQIWLASLSQQIRM